MIRALRLMAVACALVGSGCGSSDEEEAAKTVREFAKASNAGDVDKVCDELVTEEFLEKTYFAVGGRAQEVCRQEVGKLKRPTLRVLEARTERVKDDRATVVAVIESRAQRQLQTFLLEKEGGRWRISGGSAD